MVSTIKIIATILNVLTIILNLISFAIILDLIKKDPIYKLSKIEKIFKKLSGY